MYYYVSIREFLLQFLVAYAASVEITSDPRLLQIQQSVEMRRSNAYSAVNQSLLHGTSMVSTTK